MLTLAQLAALAAEAPDALTTAVAPLRLAGQTHDLDRTPLLMGVVNLSRDSTYRDSIAVSVPSAIRRARVMHAQGAGVIDIGAESTTARARRVGADQQVAALVPVVEALTEAGIPTSVEGYDVEVVRAGLAAGAAMVNLTGATAAEPIYDLAAEAEAAVVLCFVPGQDARDIGPVDLGSDPIAGLIDYFGPRIDTARAHGVTDIVIDPGLGFYYSDLIDPAARVRHQTQVLLRGFRLRTLGVPICQALPHAFDLFEEEFRTAEGFFAVLARLGMASVLRTHEVARVQAVLRALDGLGDDLLANVSQEVG